MLERKEENKIVVEDSLIETQDTILSSESSKVEEESVENVETSTPEKKPLLEPLKTSRFFLIRILYHILRSIWIVAMVVGGFIAWIISLLFI